MSTLFQGLVLGSSGYALYKVTPDMPYAYAAFGILLGHSMVGLAKSVKCSDFTINAFALTSLLAEILPLPLINMQLYSASSTSKELALCHGLSAIIPLMLSLMSRCGDRAAARTNQKLIDLTILGNVMSLLFLAVNERNYWFGSIALTAFATKFALSNLECDIVTNQNSAMMGNTILSVLALRSITKGF